MKGLNRARVALLACAVAIMPVACAITTASASAITFGFEGELIQVGGPNGLSVGDTFTGSFSYTVEQAGTSVPAVTPGQVSHYAFDSYSLTIQGQTVSSTGGDLSIWNNTSLGDRFHLTADLTTPSALVTGSINGAPATQLFLALAALSGDPFMNMSLPAALNLADFPDLKRVDVIFSPGNGAVIGEITNLSVVPLPSAGWLFIPGLSSFFLWRMRTERRAAS